MCRFLDRRENTFKKSQKEKKVREKKGRTKQNATCVRLPFFSDTSGWVVPQIEYDRFEGDHRKRRSEKLGKGIVEGVRRRSRNSEEVDQTRTNSPQDLELDFSQAMCTVVVSKQSCKHGNHPILRGGHRTTPIFFF